jgi:uncharacterized protein with HEPN domain
MSKKRTLKVILEDIIEEIERIKRFTQGIEKYNNFVDIKKKLLELEKE